MPDAPLPPLPPVGQPRWRTAADELLRRAPASPQAWLPAAVGAVLAVVTFMAVVAAPTLLRPGAGGPDPQLPVVPAAPEPSVPSPRDGPSPRTQPEEVVVDVSGAVARAGLVRLRVGSRVADAVSAAGGPAAGADLTTLNQARVLADGEQVRVPREGEPPPPPASVPAAGTGTAAPAVVLDLNLATVAELDVLPGVGPATAAAIVTWREENGGFRSVADLLEVPGIGPAKLERLRPHVRV